MAITIYENKQAGGVRIKLDRRLCLTDAGELVEAGNPDARRLYGSKGKEVPRSEFEALGGVVGDPSAAVPEPPAPDPEPEPEITPTTKPRRKRKRKTKKGK